VNNGSPFGVAAHRIKSVKANIGGKILKLNNVSTQDQIAAAYTAAGITSTDPRVTII
jgi:S-adenosylhomocysteine hydrolase